MLYLIKTNAFSVTIKIDSLEKINSYNETKKYYESIINNSSNKNHEQNNNIKRWLWENRNGENNIEYTNQELFNSSNSKTKLNSTQSQKGWSPLGPIIVPESYAEYSGHSIGRINCITFHPTNKNIFWVGSANGGIWKTVNAGKNWTPLSDDLPTLAVSSIAVDNKNPNILYFASGDYDGGNGENLGVFKSLDGGITWQQTSLVKDSNFAYSSLKKIIINPENTNQLIVVGKKGIWKSNDEGKTWIFTNIKLVSDLEISPINSKTLYIATSSSYNFNNTSIRKSTDFGITWDSLKTGIPSSWAEISRLEIAISTSDPNYIYAIGSNSINGRNGGFHSFYKSTDAGSTCDSVCTYKSTENILGFYNGKSDDLKGQGSYNLTMLIDQNDKNKVYIGGTNIWMSKDAGKNWDIVSYWVNCFGKSVHADQHFSAYNPLDSNIYFTNDGGVYRSINVNSGSKDWLNEVDKFYGEPLPNTPKYKFPTIWENISDGLATTQFYKIALSKNNPGYVTGGAQDNSCYYYNLNNWFNYITNWDGMSTLIDHNDPAVIYGVWQSGGLCRSDDGGKNIELLLADTLTSTSKLGENGNWVTPMDMDPNDSKTIYFGLRNLWRSNDKGKSWNKVLNIDTIKYADTLKLNYNISYDLVKTSYNNSNYLSCYRHGPSVKDTLSKKDFYLPNELWITKDAGKNWLKSTTNLPLNSFALVAIEYDKVNPEIMWVATNIKTIYNSSDGGKSWKLIPKDLPSNLNISTLVHYQNSSLNTIFAGTNKGVYYTNDTMKTWEAYNLNLPMCEIRDLKIHELSGKLYAGTYGRGIWETSILEAPNSVEEEKLDYTFDINPNPNNGIFHINYKTIFNLSNDLDCLILDVLGRKVWSGKIDTKSNEIQKSFNLQLEDGVYFIKLNFGGIDFVKRFVVIK